jgi:hypothetical protein
MGNLVPMKARFGSCAVVLGRRGAMFGVALALVLLLVPVGGVAVAATCGVERWSVKTGTDPNAHLINLSNATTATVASLAGNPAPRPIPSNNSNCL